jgi:3-dehydroquinate dehydratase/shikimate dehydrogenase
VTRIVCPLAPANASEFRRLARLARDQGADAVELRLDTALRAGARADDLLPVIAGLGCDVLATCRHRAEGGAFDGGEDERLELLRRTDAAGARWIDCELFAVRGLGTRPGKAELVLSYHDFAGLGGGYDALSERIRAMRAAGAHIAKLAVTPGDAHDLAIIARLAARAEGPLVAIAMGEHGLPSRALAGAWGLAFTFGRLAGDHGSAPGQPTVTELRQRYRVHRQGPATRIFGVIGDPVGHSLSPAIHNAAFAHDGVDAVYVPFRVADARRFWDDCGGWIDGLSITIPHKESLLQRMDTLDPVVPAIGAMNTVLRGADGGCRGANTDASAIVACLEEACGRLHGKRVLLLGAGGVARAAAHCLTAAGCRVAIANRTRERAVELAATCGASVVDPEPAAAGAYDILVNGTSVGLKEDRSPWPAHAHHSGSVVFDTVYVPLETRLLREALAAGARTVCGLEMFIHQAAEQYRRWIGQAAPRTVMRRAALEGLGVRDAADHG